MPRKSAAQKAQEAITRLLKEREKVAQRLGQLDEQIDEIRSQIGEPKKMGWPPPLLPVEVESTEISGPAADLAPQDTQGDGRWV